MSLVKQHLFNGVEGILQSVTEANLRAKGKGSRPARPSQLQFFCAHGRTNQLGRRWPNQTTATPRRQQLESSAERSSFLNVLPWDVLGQWVNMQCKHFSPEEFLGFILWARRIWGENPVLSPSFCKIKWERPSWPEKIDKYEMSNCVLPCCDLPRVL